MTLPAGRDSTTAEVVNRLVLVTLLLLGLEGFFGTELGPSPVDLVPKPSLGIRAPDSSDSFRRCAVAVYLEAWQLETPTAGRVCNCSKLASVQCKGNRKS